MIYKAAPMQNYRVATSMSQHNFLSTDNLGAGAYAYDSLLLSQFDEDQSMVHQGPSGGTGRLLQNSHPSSGGTAPTMMANPRDGYLAHHMDCQSPFPCLEPTTATGERRPEMNEMSCTESQDRNCQGGPHSMAATDRQPSMLNQIGSIPDFAGSSLMPPTPESGPKAESQELPIRISQSCFALGQQSHVHLPLVAGYSKQ
jgi:hypothetical protein